MKYYGYIYLTENLVNGKKYIGQHHWENNGIDTKYYGSGKHLLRAINKYGKENFVVHILERCKTKWEANAREKAWIRFYDANHSPEFYNITPGGDGTGAGENHPWHGHHHTDEARKKISEAIGVENNHWRGKHHSEETKKKMSEQRRGKNNSFYGRHHTEETKQKIRENHPDFSGEKHPRYGYRYTEEEKQKLSITHSKLPENQVLEIVALRKQGFILKELAERFGVSLMTISNICNGNTYSFITRYRSINQIIWGVVILPFIMAPDTAWIIRAFYYGLNPRVTSEVQQYSVSINNSTGE